MSKSLATELTERRAALIKQATDIARKGVNENRELTASEQATFDEHIAEAEAIQERAKQIHDGERAAGELNESFRNVTGAYPGQPTSNSCPSLLVSADNIAKHVEAMNEGRSFGAMEEQRALIQINPAAATGMGGASAYGQTGTREPRHLILVAGIPVQALNGVSATMAKYTLPAAAAGVNETTAHGEYDAVTDVPLTAVRYGRWSAASAAVRSFNPLVNLVNAHAIGIAKDLDKLAAGNIETAAGTPAAYAADIPGNVRNTVLSVAANVLGDPTELVIFGQPSAIALLGDTTPANGQDIGTVANRFNGALLYPTAEAAAGQLTVFHPASFLVFQSKLQSASTIDPKDGSNAFGSWLHSTPVGQGLAGSALAVDVTA